MAETQSVATIAGVLVWLEDSGLGHFMRNAGVWSYGVANLIHILGVATLFGSVLVLDLRLLGFWARTPLDAIAAPTVPLAAIGFTIAALSGACLIATNGSEYIGNPFLLIKFPAIGLALLNAVLLSLYGPWRERAVRAPTARQTLLLALFGGISLVFWVTAVSAGRLIGYW